MGMNMNGFNALEGIEDAIKELENEIGDSTAQDDVVEDKTAEDMVDEAVEDFQDEEAEEDDAADDEPEDEDDDGDTEEDSDEQLSEEDKERKLEERKRNYAFTSMRKEKEELQKQLQEMREQMAKLQGSQETIQAMQTPAKSEEEANPEPDKNLYPEEWNEWKSNELEKRQASFEEQQKAMQEQMVLQQEYAGVQKLESDYRGSNPDSNYDDALAHVMKNEALKIKMMHPTATDAEIQQHLDSQKLAMFRANPLQAAKTIVEIAQASGFTADKPKKKVSKKARMDKLKKNVEQHTNVMGGSSATGGDEVTPEQLLDMSMDELLRTGKSGFNSAISVSKRRR